MGKLLNLVTPLHKNTPRDYLGRMANDKVNCMLKSKEYEYDYWDGDRRYGYGGYNYDARWRPVAQKLIEIYGIKDGAKILDVGCGKAHLLYELKVLLPEAEVHGFDVSRHGISDAPELIRDNLFVYKAQSPYPWKDKYFDLVISIISLHNLKIYDLQPALKEIERVGKNKYIAVESYRNEQELFNLQCWALTCETFLSSESWVWLYNHFGYTGDYEFVYFE
jgi:ubiquinone/menaquinone biosynthesis C-methylase UbiE